MTGFERHLTRLRNAQVFRRALWLSGSLLLGAIANYVLHGPYPSLLLGVAIAIFALILGLAFTVVHDRIDFQIGTRMEASLSDLKVVAQDFPEYRFADVFRAVETHFTKGELGVLDSEHNEELGAILMGNFYGGAGFLQSSANQPCFVGPGKEECLPRERYWFVGRPGARHTLIRLRRLTSAATARLELANPSRTESERLLAELRERSVVASIYRGQAIEVSFAPGVKDEWGNVDQVGNVKVEFRKSPPLRHDEVVLDPRVWPTLEHSLVSFHRQREALTKHRVMQKRGFLFYGPPGTGKSFIARYLATQLEGTTFVFCSGAALHHVGSAFNLARLFKPAVVVMDDVDLVFASRDINQHGSALGDLFDQIDAISDAEPISIVMTTNAIERVEAAVKDRPGRVSQCIFFGPPSAELRRRYLEVQLCGHDLRGVDLDEVVERTAGATQAYLKELGHRALQFALEAERFGDERLRPTTEDFIAALDEINAFDNRAARNITGFRSG